MRVQFLPSSTMDITKLTKEDYQKFYVVKPDPGFSAARNQAIIEETIRETDANHQRKMKERLDGLGERSEVVGSYIHHLVNKNDSTPIEKYIGKRYLAQLQGEERLERMKQLAAQRGLL